MANDTQNVYAAPGSQHSYSIKFTGGGPIPHWFVPTFAAQNPGTSINVDFYDLSGAWLQRTNYPLSSTNVGVAALSTAGSGNTPTFINDCPPTAVGYQAFAVGGPVRVGRGGIIVPNNELVAGITACKQGAPYCATMVAGESFQWSLIANAGGFKFIDDYGTGSDDQFGVPVSLLGAVGLGGSAYQGLLVTGPTRVRKFKVRNTNTSTTYYLMAFDQTTAPSNGATPKMICQAGFGTPTFPTENEATVAPNFWEFNSGVYYCWSTTDGTLTLAASNAANLSVEAYG